MTQTKHQQVISYIESLTVGEKVSVRQLARELGVSEGTVYRAIKEAENQGFVTSIPKVGTLRIEKDKDRTIESLTYHELSLLLEGRFLSGSHHRDDVPKSYHVASVLEDLDSSRVLPQTLIITTNRDQLVHEAIKRNQPLLLAGDDPVSDLDQLFSIDGDQIVLACPYDIFELISLINQTIFERVKRRDVVIVGDIMTENPDVLYESDTVESYYDLRQSSQHSRFPVLNKDDNLVGIVTASDVVNATSGKLIKDLMSNNPVTAKPDDMMSYLARLLVLESTELVPVVTLNEQIAGVVTRQDVIEALQSTQKQPQYGDTLDIIVLSGFKLTARGPEVEISGLTTEFMLDEHGEVSIGNLSIIASNAAIIAARLEHNLVCQVTQQNIHLFEPIVAEMNLSATISLHFMHARELQAVVRLTSSEILLAIATMHLLPVEK